MPTPGDDTDVILLGHDDADEEDGDSLSNDTCPHGDELGEFKETSVPGRRIGGFCAPYGSGGANIEDDGDGPRISTSAQPAR